MNAKGRGQDVKCACRLGVRRHVAALQNPGGQSITLFLAKKYQKITVAGIAFRGMLADKWARAVLPGACLLNFLRYCFNHGFNES